MTKRSIVKRALMVAAIGLSAAFMAGCAVQSKSLAAQNGTGAAAPPTPAQKLQAAAASIDKNCQVGMPFLKSLLSLQTDPDAIKVMTKVNDDAGKLCAVVAVIAHPILGVDPPKLDLATVRTFANSQIPTVLDYVRRSALPDGQKTAAILAVTGAQAALNLAVVNAQ